MNTKSPQHVCGFSVFTRPCLRKTKEPQSESCGPLCTRANPRASDRRCRCLPPAASARAPRSRRTDRFPRPAAPAHSSPHRSNCGRARCPRPAPVSFSAYPWFSPRSFPSLQSISSPESTHLSSSHPSLSARHKKRSCSWQLPVFREIHIFVFLRLACEVRLHLLVVRIVEHVEMEMPLPPPSLGYPPEPPDAECLVGAFGVFAPDLGDVHDVLLPRPAEHAPVDVDHEHLVARRHKLGVVQGRQNQLAHHRAELCWDSRAAQQSVCIIGAQRLVAEGPLPPRLRVIDDIM